MNRNIHVLHVSTHNEECGIAKYQESIVDAMGKSHQIVNTFFGTSPNVLRELPPAEFNQAMERLSEDLRKADILHIQHEYSFYRGDQLGRIVNCAKQQGKKILFTLHTPPHAHRGGPRQAVRFGHTPRSWKNALHQLKAEKAFHSAYIEPLHQADLLITPSRVSIESFTAYGAPSTERYKVINLPVPAVNTHTTSSVISESLHKRKDDILLSMVGFLSETKGVIAAIKALHLLPQNYKLALIGGSHPSGQNDEFYDRVVDMIVQNDMQERVYITGYVENDTVRDAMVRETDICLYPYDHRYYDYVSSAALNNAVANSMPIVAYKTKTFLEVNEGSDFLKFASAATYYELARAVTTVDLHKQTEATKRFASRFSVEKQADLFAQTYLELADA